MLDDTDLTNQGTVAAAILAGQKIGRLSGEPKLIDRGIPFAVVAEGTRLESLEPYLRARPERTEAAPVFSETGSFCEYVNDFTVPEGTRLFADPTAQTVVAVLDYHKPTMPAWRAHRATLRLLRSPEWQAWNGRNRAAFEQQEFAEWLEDHIPDIARPEAGKIMDAVKHFEANRKVSYKRVLNLHDGTQQLTYTDEEQKGTNTVTIPSEFDLSLRYYVGEEPVLVKARLRFRLVDGELTFTYALDQVERVGERAFSAVRGAIEEATNLVVLAGTP